MFLNKNTETVLDDKFDSSVSKAEIPIRLAFLRKVYGILSAQLLFTVIICTIIVNSTGVSQYIFTSIWLFLGIIIGMFVFGVGLHLKSRQYPLNFVFLGGYTITHSIFLGSCLTFIDTENVVYALVLTTFIAISLTAYAMMAKDFNRLYASLASTSVILITGSLLQIFLRSDFLEFLLILCCVMIFSTYIVFDTHLIMNKLNPEEYMLAVITLHTDVMRLFLEILKLFKKKK